MKITPELLYQMAHGEDIPEVGYVLDSNAETQTVKTQTSIEIDPDTLNLTVRNDGSVSIGLTIPGVYYQRDDISVEIDIPPKVLRLVGDILKLSLNIE